MVGPAEEDRELVEQARGDADEVVLRPPQGLGQVQPVGLGGIRTPGRPGQAGARQEEGEGGLQARRAGQAGADRDVAGQGGLEPRADRPVGLAERPGHAPDVAAPRVVAGPPRGWTSATAKLSASPRLADRTRASPPGDRGRRPRSTGRSRRPGPGRRCSRCGCPGVRRGPGPGPGRWAGRRRSRRTRSRRSASGDVGMGRAPRGRAGEGDRTPATAGPNGPGRAVGPAKPRGSAGVRPWRRASRLPGGGRRRGRSAPR